MNWSWLRQIFRGEGKVSDVYVSHKNRRFYNCKFGFVRYKTIEEATRAVNNLNGLWIRGKRIMVSFARYGKKEVLRNGSDHSYKTRPGDRLSHDTGSLGHWFN